MTSSVFKLDCALVIQFSSVYGVEFATSKVSDSVWLLERLARTYCSATLTSVLKSPMERCIICRGVMKMKSTPSRTYTILEIPKVSKS